MDQEICGFRLVVREGNGFPEPLFCGGAFLRRSAFCKFFCKVSSRRGG